jgi:acetyl esterase/lipase
MTTTDAPVLHLPARDIPVPTHLSPEAQAMLGGASLMGDPVIPAADDIDGWRRYAAEQDATVAAIMGDRVAAVPADTSLIDVDGVRVYEVVPHGFPADDTRVYLDIHGGGFVMGGGDCCRIMALNSMRQSGVRMWAIDYRMPPDHPYPAALDDCLTVYRALLRTRRPEDIIVGGGSAGGNLSAALVLRARDEGLPMPGAVVLLTPGIDFTEGGDSFHTNAGLDPILRRSGATALHDLYADGHDLTDPYISPIFGDYTKGFPPTILTTGTRDLFLSNTVRMHRMLRNAGVEAELHVQEAAGHGGFFGLAPEDDELVALVRYFVDTHWPSRPTP